MATVRSAVVFLFFVQTGFGYKVKDGPLLTHRPTWLKLCNRSGDVEITNACLTELFAEMFPELAKGIDELNIDRFEPLTLDKVSVSKGSGAVVLTGSFFNLTVTGPSNSTPTYTDLRLAENKMNFGIYLPRLDIKAKYNLKGNILILPLVGHGNCDLVLDGVDTKISTNTSFRNVKGKEIMHIEDLKVSFTLKGMHIKLDNLFNGNKVLGRTVNTFINQNGLEVVNELEEPISESLAVIFKDIINNIFSKIPTELWLPAEDTKGVGSTTEQTAGQTGKVST